MSEGGGGLRATVPKGSGRCVETEAVRDRIRSVSIAVDHETKAPVHFVTECVVIQTDPLSGCEFFDRVRSDYAAPGC